MVRSDFVIIKNSLKLVFSRLSYLILAGVITLLLLLLAIWLPNLKFFKQLLLSNHYSFSAKLDIFWLSLGFLKTNFTPLSRVFTILTAILSGINIALLIFYLKRRFQLVRAAGPGLIGTLAGLLGVGCTSCGSVILSSIIGISASTSLLSFFPLQGAEFGILGSLIILFSIYLIAKKIQNPLVCKV